MLTKTIKEKEIIDKIIAECQVCYLGIVDHEGKPYVVPMNFGYDGQNIYLHSGPEGGVLQAVKRNPFVCITFSGHHELIYQSEQVACSYRMKSSSVICRGTVSFEEEIERKKACLNQMMTKYTDKEFVYSAPALRNVVVWKVKIEEISSKVFGAPHKYSKNYDKNDEIFS